MKIQGNSAENCIGALSGHSLQCCVARGTCFISVLSLGWLRASVAPQRARQNNVSPGVLAANVVANVCGGLQRLLRPQAHPSLALHTTSCFTASYSVERCSTMPGGWCTRYCGPVRTSAGCISYILSAMCSVKWTPENWLQPAVHTVPHGMRQVHDVACTAPGCAKPTPCCESSLTWHVNK